MQPKDALQDLSMEVGRGGVVTYSGTCHLSYVPDVLTLMDTCIKDIVVLYSNLFQIFHVIRLDVVVTARVVDCIVLGDFPISNRVC